MAEHAVGGVGRLVDGAAGNAEQRDAEGGRHHAVGEVLGETLDGGARHPRLVERRRIAPDDMGDGDAARLDAARSSAWATA